MRKPIIAGNWKMNKTASEAKEFAEAVKNNIPSNEKVDSVIGSPALFLQELMASAEGTELKISAQNCYWENSGAFTGETSPAALADLGVDYVIIGHSERREYFHETDEDINKKAKAIFANGMIPILCCGESLETYEAGKTAEWIEGQITAGLEGLTDGQVSNMVIAYEPIWAIGTGKTATNEQANETIMAIRAVLAEMFGKEVADKIRIQYGGSVKPNTIKDQMAMSDIDGALVGGASLVAADFSQIVNF